MAQPAALSTVFPACHHSRLPKQQSKVTVTRSRGERLQLGVAAGLTGHWSSNVTASHWGVEGWGRFRPAPAPSAWTLVSLRFLGLPLSLCCFRLGLTLALNGSWSIPPSNPPPSSSPPDFRACSPAPIPHLRQETGGSLPGPVIKTCGEWLGSGFVNELVCVQRCKLQCGCES